ncbi:MAG: hypothetical protein WAV18_07950 [Roseiarcus sp.]
MWASIFSKHLLYRLNFVNRVVGLISPHFDPSKAAFLFLISLVKIGAARSRFAAALGSVPPRREIAQVNKGADYGSARARRASITDSSAKQP